MDHVKEPQARAAMIWLIGEYCGLIDKADLILDPFLDVFHDEPPPVQLQILGAVVKLYLRDPEDTKDMLQLVLNEATKQNNLPDVKSRALFYWRMLSGDLARAEKIIRFPKVTVLQCGEKLDDAVLEELIGNMGTVSGVLHVLPADFVRRVKFVPEDDMILNEEQLHRWSPMKLDDQSFLLVSYDFDGAHLYLTVANKCQNSLSGLAVAINRNVIGLTMSESPVVPEALEFGDSAESSVPIRFDQAMVGTAGVTELQIAIRTSFGNVFGSCRIPVELATVESGKISEELFASYYRDFPYQREIVIEGASVAVESEFAQRRIYVVSKTKHGYCLSFALVSGQRYVCELTKSVRNIVVVIKSESLENLALVEASAEYLFAAKDFQGKGF
jgi:hypothetical protein